MCASEVRVAVQAADGVDEVMLVDGRFRVLAHGIGEVEADVAPGIYRAVARNGDASRDTLFAVSEADRVRVVRLDPVVFATPIPLAGTSRTRQRHAASAAGIGAAPTARLGTGAGLAILLRDPGEPDRELDPAALGHHAASFDGFDLTGPGIDGRIALDAIATREVAAGYLLANAEVAPGAYVLRAPPRHGERRCMPLVVPAGWTLQLFVAMVPDAQDSAARLADLDDAAVVIERTGVPFIPEREDLKLLELARRALARGEGIIDRDAMRALLRGKFDNPMLGLMAAHLILLRAEPDLALLDIVLGNTASLLGRDHPDVVALEARRARLGDLATSTDRLTAIVTRLHAPPMLQLGWRYVMEAARALSSPPRGGPFALAGQVVDASVWVNWIESDAHPSVAVPMVGTVAPHADDGPLAEMLGRVTANLRTFVARPEAITRSRPELGELTREIARAVLDRVSSAAEAEHMRDLTERGIALLAEHVDWPAVVRRLKRMVHTRGGRELTLSPAQRRLALALKELHEMASDGDGLTGTELREWLERQGLAVSGLSTDLARLLAVAEQVLDRRGDEAPPERLEG